MKIIVIDRLKNKKNTLHKNTVSDFDIAVRDKPQSGTADDNLIAQELEYKIIKAISKLPERCRIIFEYSRFRNYTYPEIALKLNISVKTVETQMSIALDKLRMQLADLLPILFFIIMLKI
ncbi:MAG: sigma-70 family RNA polymerase sigma factor [Bacteroidetes bacterium]|nr:sigma-70 family RNA polymerase sigma factor [Bacteroidota bacterium]